MGEDDMARFFSVVFVVSFVLGLIEAIREDK
jgi:hypothetical protein